MDKNILQQAAAAAPAAPNNPNSPEHRHLADNVTRAVRRLQFAAAIVVMASGRADRDVADVLSGASDLIDLCMTDLRIATEATP